MFTILHFSKTTLLILMMLLFGVTATFAYQHDSITEAHISNDILSDGQFVYGPNVGDFYLEEYLAKSSSPLITYETLLEDKAWFYSINPRVLLVIMEIRGEAVSQPDANADQVIGYVDVSGFDRQLEVLSETLVRYFYADLYETPDLPVSSTGEWVIELANGETALLSPNTNSATLAVLATLGALSTPQQWENLASPTASNGFVQTYKRLFPESNPLDNSNLIIPNTPPPTNLFKFPFMAGDTWVFSSGPHEWDGCDGEGDPYSGVDFAPGGYSCDNVPTDRWVTSVAAGTVNYLGSTGAEVYMTFDPPNNAWGVRHLHIANTVVSANQHVTQDTQIGNPSCLACVGCSGSHGHFDLRYNGAWTPIEGTAFEGWVVHGTTCYNGYLERNGVTIPKGETVTSESNSGCCGCGSQTSIYDTAFLTDAELTAHTSMSAQDIRNFLTAHNSYFRNPVVDVDGVTFDMADVMAQAAVTHQISPKVLLATLQKESSSVTTSTRPGSMGWIMGYGSPSTARDQVNDAAGAFRWYQNTIQNTGQTPTGWQVGVGKQTLDGVTVTPATNAVAGQFTYTPHAGAGWGGSAGGVNLFYQIWDDFGFGAGLASNTDMFQLNFPEIDNYAFTAVSNSNEYPLIIQPPPDDNLLWIEDLAPEWYSTIEPVVIITNEVLPPSFAWAEAVDETGYVLDYLVYWGNDPQGTDDVITNITTFISSEVLLSADSPATRYLRVAARDDTGHVSNWQTMGIWQYDPVPPTGSFMVGNGGNTAQVLNTTLNLDVKDESDRITEMRFSKDGRFWTSWEPFTTSLHWQLENIDTLQTVYAQVIDTAGNVSEIMSASTTVLLNIEPPSSSSYQIGCSVFGMGGGTQSSSNYTVFNTVGQFHDTAPMISGGYQVHSGFETACATLGTTTPPPTPDYSIFLPAILK